MHTSRWPVIAAACSGVIFSVCWVEEGSAPALSSSDTAAQLPVYAAICSAVPKLTTIASKSLNGRRWRRIATQPKQQQRWTAEEHALLQQLTEGKHFGDGGWWDSL